MAKHANGCWAKIATVYIALALLFAGLSPWWLGANALQRTDTDTTAPSSPANNVGYDPVTPGDWTTEPREVGSALDTLGTIAGGSGTAVTAAAASGAVNTVQVSAGADRTIQDAAGTSIFGNATLAAHVGLQFKNVDGGTGLLTWWNSATTARFLFSNPVQLSGHIVDSSANEIIRAIGVASALNELTITNAATTNDPSIAATGETNVGIIIASKGTGVVSIPGVGTGGYTDYDLLVGDVTTPDYGVIRFGNAMIGRLSHNAASIDLDGAIVIRNIGGPVTSEIEFAVVESGGADCRFAIPKSAVGNATYNPRSLLNAGPAPADTDFVKVSYWQGQGIFDNLACDTAGDGADLGVQNDLEVEGDIFVDSIFESTTAAGVTIDGVPIKDGEVDGRNIADLLAFFNGTFVESFDALVTSDGTVVTMSIEQTGGGDLTMQFSDGQATLDCTPAATIGPTTGSDASPTGNFIYVPQSTKVLTKSTSDWPSAEHIKIAYLLVPSPGYVQTNGVYVNHNTNDHAQGTDGQGHLVHITERLRSQHAIYKSGVSLTMTVGGGTTVDVAVTSGIIYQMHKHATPSLDTATGDAVLVINQNGAAYDDVTNLETLTNDSAGVAVKKYFNWVFWGIGNKGGEYSPLAMNLPTGSYNQLASAEADVSGFDVLTIPVEFSSDSQTGFLIARVTMSKIGGTWAHVSTVDLRGATPQTVVGGVGGVDTEFADNAFKLFDESDNTKILDFQLSGLTTGNTRTITMADANVDLAQVHAESHTVVSHSDTTGTGAELDTLTDGSNADALHVHEGTAILSAGPVTDGWVLTADGAGAAAWEVLPAGGAHDLLSATHTDSVANAVTRGSLIYGNATPKWDELVLGGAATYLRSNGTDAAWTALAVADDPSPQLGADLDAASFDIDNWHTLDGVRDGGRALVKGTSYGDEARWVSSRAQGSLASPTAVGVNNVIGSFTFTGYDGSAFRARAYFEAIVDGAVSASAVPIALRFRTGTTSPTERWRTQSDGHTLVVSDNEWQFRAATNRIYSSTAGNITVGGNSGTILDVAGNTLVACSANTIKFHNSGGGMYGDIYVGTATELQIRDSAAAAKVRISTTGIAFYATAPVAQHAAMTALTDFIVPATAPSPADFTIRTLVDSSVGANWGFASDDEGHTVLAAIRNLQDRVDELEAMLAASTGVGIHGG